jgi:hypothetical protein
MESEMITKEIFVGAIDSIREQMTTDKLNSSVLTEMFPGSELSTYNNSLLIKGILDLLRLWFPREDGFCELEHYCFDLDFGRGAEETETTEMFYYRLVGESVFEENQNEPNLYAKQDNTEIVRHISQSISHLI